jgi:hypothetical protein
MTQCTYEKDGKWYEGSVPHEKNACGEDSMVSRRDDWRNDEEATKHHREIPTPSWAKDD